MPSTTLNIRSVRLWLTTFGVFLLMGAFITYLQANAGIRLGASTFRRYRASLQEMRQEITLQPLGEAQAEIKTLEE